jgi:hypothetical protein
VYRVKMMVGDYVPGYGDGIFGRIGGILGRAALGFATGGPLGAITGAIGGTARGVARGVREETLAAGGSESAYTPLMRRHHAMILAHAKGGSTMPIGSSTAGTAHHGRGMRLARGEAAGGGRRRMNWANHRALSRAERRIKLAVKHLGHYIKWVHHKKEGHAVPSFTGRRASAYPKKKGARLAVA